jgi:arylsulfatase A-like enzyme
MNILHRLLALLLIPAAASTFAAERPNVIVILSDDMGFSDLGCYGSEIATPNLDSLAKGGVRFTQFYNTARCCPTRASLLTGLHPHQAGMGHMTVGRVVPDGFMGNLNKRCVTIAEALKPAGYRTYMTGKWHVARESKPDGPKDTWPLQRGFDRFYGTLDGAGSFYDPTTLCRGNTFITPENDAEYRPGKYYYTDAISDNAVKFLREHKREQPEKPFFLYVAYTAAHWPMQALPEDIAKYKGRYDAGYTPIRQARYEKARQLGILSATWPLTPQAENWDTVPDKAWEARCMEVFAAMVDRMDQGIGKILAELREQGRLDNTLILYLQDNGGCAELMGRKSNEDKIAGGTLKPFTPDTLQPAVWPPMQTRDGRHVRTGPGVMPGPEDTYIGYGRGWANVSNTPFREYKHWTHEGGISTPLIAHWPVGIPEARRNQLVHEPGQLTDIMATCIDVAGAPYPAEVRGGKIHPLEGRSLAPLFSAAPLPSSPRLLYWEHEGNRAVREGEWKLVAKGPKASWELYNIAADRSELNNLSTNEPARVTDLSAKWDAWAKRANVLPWPWDDGAAGQGVSQKTHFDLTPNANLPKGEVPDYTNRGFSVTVNIAQPGTDGVLVAQGGDAHGWALFFEKGALHFAINRASELEDFFVSEKFADAKSITARLSPGRTLTLLADGRELLQKADIAFPQVLPAEGLQVGRDLRGTVGDYKPPFAFTGKISSATIDLSPR